MIAIKGMEMPESCIDCPFVKAEGTKFFCSRIMKYIDKDNLGNKHDDCPLVEIVTCKDCGNHVTGALDEEICLKGHELINESFYCKDGERRESNATERK